MKKMKKNRHLNLDYLRNQPKTIYWRVIAGSGLSDIQSYDLVFDDYDLKIRQIEKKFEDL